MELWFSIWLTRMKVSIWLGCSFLALMFFSNSLYLNVLLYFEINKIFLRWSKTNITTFTLLWITHNLGKIWNIWVHILSRSLKRLKKIVDILKLTLRSTFFYSFVYLHNSIRFEINKFKNPKVYSRTDCCETHIYKYVIL